MGFNTGMSEDDVEEIRREYELELGGLEKELATLRAEVEKYKEAWILEQSLAVKYHEDLSVARAYNEKLRAALALIMSRYEEGTIANWKANEALK